MMLGLVYRKGSSLAETFITNITLERLLFVVDVLVVTEMVLSSEGLATCVTGIGPLSGVCSLMDEEVVALGELPVTVLADVALLVASGAGTTTSCRRTQQKVAEGHFWL